MPVYDCGAPDCLQCRDMFRTGHGGKRPERDGTSSEGTGAPRRSLKRPGKNAPLSDWEQVYGELSAALTQAIPSDDQIIVDHIRAAREIALRNVRREIKS